MRAALANAWRCQRQTGPTCRLPLTTRDAAGKPHGRCFRPFKPHGGNTGNRLLQPPALGARLGEQLVPVIRRMTSFQHLAEHPAGVVAALVGAFGVAVVDPGEHDHLAWRVVAKEQSALLKEFGAKPVLVLFTERTALPVLRSCRVLRRSPTCDFVMAEPHRSSREARRRRAGGIPGLFRIALCCSPE